MNKLTKIGVSALCGSLATVASAQAGEMTVAGSASATYMSLTDEVTGNPLGMATGMTFTGTGELDNGSAVTLTIANTHKNAYTGSSITVATPSYGTFKYDEKGGTGLDRIDDMMPTAWEEVDGTGIGMGLQTVTGVGGGSDIEWTLPAEWSMGSTIHLSYSFHPDGTYNSKKGSSGTNGTSGRNDGGGYDIVVSNNTAVEGLNMFAGYSEVSQSMDAAGHALDKTQFATGFTYAVGGFTFGAQMSQSDDAVSYENQAYGVSFAVNDNLSLSYARHDSEQDANHAHSVELEGKSLQASYTMGGASLVVAETEVDNKEYATAAANQREGRSIALTLAF
jgi:outer membrane protein OmpU|tara:strand:+ start:132 stop:1139 length:1008 start_codon:yes stop_codon:yes gene_type:complete